MEIQELQVRITAETRQLNNSINQIKADLNQISKRNLDNEKSFRDFSRNGAKDFSNLSQAAQAMSIRVKDAISTALDSARKTVTQFTSTTSIIDVGKMRQEASEVKAEMSNLTDEIEQQLNKLSSYKAINGAYEDDIEELISLEHQYEDLNRQLREYTSYLYAPGGKGTKHYQEYQEITELQRKLYDLKQAEEEVDRALKTTDYRSDNWAKLLKQSTQISLKIQDIREEIEAAYKSAQQETAKVAAEKLNKELGNTTRQAKTARNSIAEIAHQLSAIGGKPGAVYSRVASLIDMFSNLSAKSKETGEDGSNAMGAIGSAAGIAGGKVGMIIAIITAVLQVVGKLGKGLKRIGDFINRLDVFKNTGRAILKILTTFLQKARTTFIFTAINQAFLRIRNTVEALIKSNDKLLESIQYTKGAWITAFQPIYERIIPIIISLMNYLEQLGYKVALFIARLTGKNPAEMQAAAKRLWDQARAYQGIGSAAEEAGRQLAKFDELNILQDNKSNSSGYGSDDNALFKDFDNWGFKEYKTWGEWLEDFIERLRDKIGKFGNFTKKAAQAINNFAKKFKGMLDYGTNRERGIKFAEELAESLNNFIQNIDAEGLGTALGQFVGWVFEMMGAFFKKLDWYSLGKRIGEFISKAIKAMDLNVVLGAIVAKINGIIKMINGFLAQLETGEAGYSITDALGNALGQLDWAGIGSILSKVIEKVVNLLTGLIMGWDWFEITMTLGMAVMQILSAVDWSSIGKALLVQFMAVTLHALGSLGKNLAGIGIVTLLGGANLFAGWGASFIKMIFGIDSKDWDEATSGLTSGFDRLRMAIIMAMAKVAKPFYDLKDKIKDALDGALLVVVELISKINIKFQNFKTACEKIFKNLGTGILTVWANLVIDIKKPINGIIDILNKLLLGVDVAIAGLIMAWNKTAAKLPGLSEIDTTKVKPFEPIPHLARGGVITKPTMAMVGEYAGANNNPEIVAPRSMLEQIFNSSNAELVDVMLQLGQQVIQAIGNVDMEVTVGDETIAKSVQRANRQNIARTGYALI